MNLRVLLLALVAALPLAAHPERDVAPYRNHLAESTNPAVRLPSRAGIDCLERMKWDSAAIKFRQALSKAHGSELVALYSLLGRSDFQQRRFSPALTSYRQSLELARTYGDTTGMINALESISLVFEEDGRLDSALAWLYQLPPLDSILGQRRVRLEHLTDIGVVFRHRYAMDSATAYFLQARAVAQELGDETNEVALLLKLGLVRGEIDDCTEGLRYDQAALELARKLGDVASEARALNQLGRMHYVLGDIEAAVASLLPALRISDEPGLHEERDYAFRTLAGCLQKSDREHFVTACGQAGLDQAAASALADDAQQSLQHR
jgi:tetratricopeptide (TPR) repeat protein